MHMMSRTGSHACTNEEYLAMCTLGYSATIGSKMAVMIIIQACLKTENSQCIKLRGQACMPTPMHENTSQVCCIYCYTLGVFRNLILILIFSV